MFCYFRVIDYIFIFLPNMKAINIFLNNPSSHTELEEIVKTNISNYLKLFEFYKINLTSSNDYYSKVFLSSHLLFEYNDLYNLYYLQNLINDSAISNIEKETSSIQSTIRKLYFDFFKQNNFIKY